MRRSSSFSFWSFCALFGAAGAALLLLAVVAVGAAMGAALGEEAAIAAARVIGAAALPLSGLALGAGGGGAEITGRSHSQEIA